MSVKNKKKQQTKSFRFSYESFAILGVWNNSDTPEERMEIKLKFHPDPLDTSTDITKHIQLLSNMFAGSIKQLMSVVHPLPQPTEEEFNDHTYSFEEHQKDYGEGLYALYQYKKNLMEYVDQTVSTALFEAFHDVFFVKGAEEKIFDQLREKALEKRDKNTEEINLDRIVNEEKKGKVN